MPTEKFFNLPNKSADSSLARCKNVYLTCGLRPVTLRLFPIALPRFDDFTILRFFDNRQVHLATIFFNKSSTRILILKFYAYHLSCQNDK